MLYKIQLDDKRQRQKHIFKLALTVVMKREIRNEHRFFHLALVHRVLQSL